MFTFRKSGDTQHEEHEKSCFTMFYERLVNKACLTKNIVPIIPQHREMYAYLYYEYIYICKYTQKIFFLHISAMFSITSGNALFPN